ncbi:MAG TPA: tRNA (adenosine(37)-N6)-threonylcarbamoyltransferase complex transferase subunit TsaD [Gemmatimonadales bacterium]|jgi:N6-L-threonylcarbamoyladenine synthase|nr:tRNA (adenosine(37)-N6)-threonylcarbamoyltransferase complex transferase subunit TsaD [Gemmatimonadales bacterium]
MAEWVLGIETSCDETSAAVLRRTGDRSEIAGLTILSQDVHRIFGGVVPELASRAHLQVIGSVVDQALADAGIPLERVDGIAVTAGPGLVGALLVGVLYGKGLAYSLDRPLLGVNHLEGHLFAPTLEDPELAPPFVGLLVSGGHTMLLDVPAWGEYRLLGQTLDDAAGEAFDKVAKLLGLGYPGGAPVERLARQGVPDRFRFPRPMVQELERDGPNRYAFSFSGLKTAVLRAVRPDPRAAPPSLDEQTRADIAWAFQEAVTDVLVRKTAHAVEALGYPAAMIGGGVACNRTLVARLRDRLAGTARVSVASPRLNTDNAAMIAAAGAWRLARGERSGWDLEPRDDLPLPGLVVPLPV